MIRNSQPAIAALVVSVAALADEPGMQTDALRGVAKIQNEASALRSVVSSEIAPKFLDATVRLPNVEKAYGKLYLGKTTVRSG